MIELAQHDDNKGLSEQYMARLQSPLELAASHLLKCIQNPREDVESQHSHNFKVQYIQYVKAHCRRRLSATLTTDSGAIPYDQVSTVLRDCLIDFYTRVYVSLSVDELDCLKTRLVMFPAGQNVDWEELLNLYFQVEKNTKDLYSVLPGAAIEYAIARAFFNTALCIGLAGDQFDEKVVQEGLDQLHDLLTYSIKVMWEGYWSMFDSPPYTAKILRLKQRASAFKFDSHQLRQHGFHTSVPIRYNEIIAPHEAADALYLFAEEHALKAQQLIDRAELDAYQQQHEFPSTTALPMQLVETLVVESGPPERDEPEPPPQLTVSPAYQDNIALALKPYVSSGFDSLKCLLASQVGTELVVVEGRPMNGIADLFSQSLMAGHINNKKTELARWLVHWFRKQDKDGQKNWAYTSVYPALTKNRRPAKSSRIPYKP